MALAVLAAIVLAATILILQPILVPPDRPSAVPSPNPLESAPGPTVVTSPASGSPSVGTPSGAPAGRVGDYTCLTVAAASDRIEADGYVVGQVNANISGGPVGDDWLVERHEPPPGSPADPGATIDLVISSPFDIC